MRGVCGGTSRHTIFLEGKNNLKGDERIKKDMTSAKWLCFTDQSQWTEKHPGSCFSREWWCSICIISVHWAFIRPPYLASAPFVLTIYCYGAGARRAEGAHMGASSRLRFWWGKGELGPVSGLRLSLGLTVHNEGFRMYIPIRISSPVGEQAPACIPEIHRPLSSTCPAFRWQVSLSPQNPAPAFGWMGGKTLGPSPTPIWSHGLSLLPPLLEPGVHLFFFFFWWW